MSVRDQLDEEERAQAARALIDHHVVDDPDTMVLVRRHREWLARTFAETLGYELRLPDSSCARIVKRFDATRARDVPRAPRSASEARRPIDERPALDRTTIQVICLVCAALETTPSDQLPLGDLAEQAQREARELDLPDLDWTRAAVRDALSDAVGWLCGLGVLVHRAGQAGRLHTDRGGEEAFYDIDRGRLAMLLADPSTTAAAAGLDGVVAPATYPPTQSGQLAVLRHEVSRRLVEDPVVYRHRPNGPFTSHHIDAAADAAWGERRTSWERAATALTGLDRETRLEGTALISADRSMTDRPFPTDSHPKQLALLLLASLCGEALATDGGAVRRSLPVEALPGARQHCLEIVAGLMAEHHAFWKAWDPDDVRLVAEQTGRALSLLDSLGLIEDGGDRLLVLPAAHRYAGVTVARPQMALGV